MELIEFGPNLPNNLSRKGTFVVHAADCGDLRKAPYKDIIARAAAWGSDQGGYLITANFKHEVVMGIYDPEDFGYDSGDEKEIAAYLGDVYFFPCCDSLPLSPSVIRENNTVSYRGTMNDVVVTLEFPKSLTLDDALEAAKSRGLVLTELHPL